jgi:hypothetical protein
MRANRRFIRIAMLGVTVVMTLAACTSKPAPAERVLSPSEAPASVTGPVTATAQAACPRTTTFSASISVPRGPRVVYYDWRTSTGASLGAGSVSFGKNGPFTFTLTSGTVPVDHDPVTVTLVITEPSGATATGTATCA